MRNSPEQRARRGSAPAALAPEDVGRLVEELAHALRKPAEPADFAPLLPDLISDPIVDVNIVDVNNELPQILRPKPDNQRFPRLSTWRVKPPRGPSWLRRIADRLRSGTPRFATALGAATLLALASVGAINSFADLNPESSTDVAAMSANPVPSISPAVVADLMKESRRMIERGDIAAARDLLKPAAASGEATAVMALAETFDPNMLKAWGAKRGKADIAAARMLYAEALSAGVTGARRRLEALADDP